MNEWRSKTRYYNCNRDVKLHFNSRFIKQSVTSVKLAICYFNSNGRVSTWRLSNCPMSISIHREIKSDWINRNDENDKRLDLYLWCHQFRHMLIATEWNVSSVTQLHWIFGFLSTSQCVVESRAHNSHIRNEHVELVTATNSNNNNIDTCELTPMANNVCLFARRLDKFSWNALQCHCTGSELICILSAKTRFAHMIYSS